MSGLSSLYDEPVSAALAGHQTSRVVRTRPGLATFFDDVDDKEKAMLQLPSVVRPPAMESDTFVFGRASMLDCVQHTCAHLASHGFSDARWLRSPESPELDVYTTNAKTKVMTFWYLTVQRNLVVWPHTSTCHSAVATACAERDTQPRRWRTAHEHRS